MADRRLPPTDFLHECFSYDPETGAFRWKHRPLRHFADQRIADNWNARQAGAAAFVWADDGYHRCEVTHEGRRYRLRSNRVAFKMMTGEEHEMIDHRDLDTRNDRFSNLRASDRFGNRHNAPGARSNPLPKGVSMERGKFRASGHVGHRRIGLGVFTSPAAAHEAYCAWARPLHGEFFNAGEAKPSVFD